MSGVTQCVRNDSGVSEVTLVCQEWHWFVRSDTGVSGVTQVCQEWHRCVRSDTGVPGVSLVRHYQRPCHCISDTVTVSVTPSLCQ